MSRKIKYTDDMEMQDRLWYSDYHNYETMYALFKSIKEQAAANGFTGYIHVDIIDHEAVATVYTSKEHYIKVKQNNMQAGVVTARCSIDLINLIENAEKQPLY